MCYLNNKKTSKSRPNNLNSKTNEKTRDKEKITKNREQEVQQTPQQQQHLEDNTMPLKFQGKITTTYSFSGSY
jgi:translation initiation factor 2B subunit (eIF-2B alpha/beta/delta family)